MLLIAELGHTELARELEELDGIVREDERMLTVTEAAE